MRSAVVLLGLNVLVAAAGAQQVWVYGPSNTPAPVPVPGAATNATAPARPVVIYQEVSTNSNAAELVALRGVRKRFEYDNGTIMAAEKKNILHNFPNVNPAMVEEWARRVSAKMNADEYMAIAARVYASHFTNDELAKLVEGEKNVNAGKRSGLSQPLMDKWTRVLPTMAGEIAGEFAQTGATFGTEVAEQLAKEHPEWVRQSVKQPAKK